ncbi:MAG: type I glyceraldehyde-3-phosphate dehydrogenase [Cycloclasticus sp.]|nr:type I glyceraldehyde-3-phosphate dehydrogenase [Cycloclasticus sp.]MBQ0789126.1 type I glyceraldehyde-3-phosphate dehydrogenase [Cycloclasticus sp.]
MSIRVAINGFGRIGRHVLRALYEAQRNEQLQIVAINDIQPLDISAHLLQYDTTHGRFAYPVSVAGDSLVVAGDTIRYLSEANPVKLPWTALNVDLVLECSGQFSQAEPAFMHCLAGAKKVLISAPSDDKVDATIVYGVNHETLKPEHKVVSNGSCTTNCLAPMAKILQQTVGIDSGLGTVIHAYTNDQRLTDSHHTDLRRARAAGLSIIPTPTRSVKAVELIIPELKGKLDGLAIRVPTLNVALVDFTFSASKDTSVEQINQALKAASEGEMKDILGFSDVPLVSVDYNHCAASCSVDASQTMVQNQRLVKVQAWYDNEWGFANRLLDTAAAMMSC